MRTAFAPPQSVTAQGGARQDSYKGFKGFINTGGDVMVSDGRWWAVDRRCDRR